MKYQFMTMNSTVMKIKIQGKRCLNQIIERILASKKRFAVTLYSTKYPFWVFFFAN